MNDTDGIGLKELGKAGSNDNDNELQSSQLLRRDE